LLLVAYAALMTHFIFGRAFRDSLLGSQLAIHSLPYLTMWCTLASVVVSLLVSNLFRSMQRKRIACAVFGINVVIELLFALAAHRFAWLHGLFFIYVSASTLVGLSIIWILIGDWASNCHADRSRLIPGVMLFGTAVSIVAGVGITHLRVASSFRSANLILAAMNMTSAVVLLFHSSDICDPRHGFTFQDLQNRAYLPNKLLRKFALLVVMAAMTSTLLDLMFRIRVAEHYLNQSDRLHFLGLFQSSLSVCAFFSQITVGRLFQRKLASSFVHLHPAIVGVASCLFAFAPGFWQFTCLRSGEYSLRNSLFRLGSEMTYACFPDQERATVRPLIDVIGERVGDLFAAGILALLLLVNPQLPVKLGLVFLALCSLLFWYTCRSLERNIDALGMRSEQDLARTATAKYAGMAHEGAAIV
jgi:ATP/ADP translocase